MFSRGGGGVQFEGQNNKLCPQSIRVPLFLSVQSVGTLGPLRELWLIRKENISIRCLLEQSRWYSSEFFCTSAPQSVHASFGHTTGANWASLRESAAKQKSDLILHEVSQT